MPRNDDWHAHFTEWVKTIGDSDIFVKAQYRTTLEQDRLYREWADRAS